MGKAAAFGIIPGKSIESQRDTKNDRIAENAVHLSTTDTAQRDFISKILLGHGYELVGSDADAGAYSFVRSQKPSPKPATVYAGDGPELMRILQQTLPERATITISLAPDPAEKPAPLVEAETKRCRFTELTRREKEVLDRIVAGQASKIIAYELSISPRTVENHRAQVMRKMRAQNVAELVRMAVAA